MRFSMMQSLFSECKGRLIHDTGTLLLQPDTAVVAPHQGGALPDDNARIKVGNPELSRDCAVLVICKKEVVESYFRRIKLRPRTKLTALSRDCAVLVICKKEVVESYFRRVKLRPRTKLTALTRNRDCCSVPSTG